MLHHYYTGKLPELVRNLRRLYREATPAERHDGRQWYRVAHKHMAALARQYGLDTRTVAAATAAMSPQVDWDTNMRSIELLLVGHYPRGPLHDNIRKAQNILIDRALSPRAYFKSAPKVCSFAENLSGNLRTAVTVDGHMAQAALGNVLSDLRLREKVYAVFADAVVHAAQGAPWEINELPANFQAIVWLVWKRLHPAARKRELRRKW